jgi:type II secretory pathway pseudopilin PulG
LDQTVSKENQVLLISFTRNQREPRTKGNLSVYLFRNQRRLVNSNQCSIVRVLFFLLSLFLSFQHYDAKSLTADRDEISAEAERIRKSLSNGESSSSSEIDVFMDAARQNQDSLHLAYGKLLKGIYLSRRFERSANDFFNEVIAYAQANDESILLCEAKIDQAFHYKNVHSKPDSSVLLFKDALALGEEIKYTQGIIRATYGIAFHLMDKGDYLSAMEYMLRIRPMANKLSDPVEKGRLLNNIGHVYMKLGLNSEASSLFEEYFETIKDTGFQTHLLVSLINRAEAYVNMDKVDSAFVILAKAYAIGQKGFPIPQKTFYYRVKGTAELKSAQYPEAFESFKSAFNEDYQYNTDRLYSLIGQSKALLGMEDTLLAHRKVKEAIELAKVYGPISLIEQADLYEAAAISFQYVKEFEQALTYQFHFINTFKKLRDYSSISKILISETKDRLEQQKQTAALERQLFERQLKSEQQKSYILLLVLLIISITALFVLLRLRERQRYTKVLHSKNELLRSQNESIEKQAKMLRETNDKITFLNKGLEEKIEKTVSQISQKDQIIDTYSFMNAHRLRSPVASIKGIASLFASVPPEDRKQLMELLEVEVDRLDQIVHEIQTILQE